MGKRVWMGKLEGMLIFAFYLLFESVVSTIDRS